MYLLVSTIKHFHIRKNVIILIVFIVSSYLFIYYIYAKNISISEHCIIMHLKAVDNNISCHYVEVGDALPSAEDPSFSPRPNSIFFHETSCRGGLNSRQACAVESASRAHPEREVYVLFSAPVSEVVYQRSCIRKLRDFPNIKFARVHINEYAKKTPLAEMVARAPFKKSKWQVEHTSDILRFLSLYKWGGVYLDSDILVVKSFTPLGHNWMVREDNLLLNAAVIAISMDDIGRKLANAVIHETRTNFRPDIWIHNGPGAITRVFHKMCDTSNLSQWSIHTCQGIKIYGPEYFYPIYYLRHKEYFKPGPLKNVDKAYTHHLWNKLSYEIKVEPDSAYAELARKFCPSIYEMYGEDFGF